MSEEPAKVRSGEREVTVEATPLAHNSSSLRTHVLVRPQEHLLVLLPSPGLGVAGRGLLLASFFPAAIAALGIVTSGGWAPWIVLAVAALVAFVGLLFLLLPRTHVFDLRQGIRTTHGLFAQAQHPLRQILAVQMSPGRPLTVGQRDRSHSSPTFELNLVLEGDRPRRSNLTCHVHGGATWQTGRYLAHALQVPFLEHAPRPQAPRSPLPTTTPPWRLALARSPRVVGLILAVPGTLALVAGVGFLVWSLAFYLHAGRAEGTVTALARGGKGTSAPVVTYEVAGKEYTYRSSFYSSPPAYRLGDKVILLYRPEDPSSCLLHFFFEEWGVALLLTGIGVACAYVGFAQLNWRPVPAAPPFPSAGAGAAGGGEAQPLPPSPPPAPPGGPA